MKLKAVTSIFLFAGLASSCISENENLEIVNYINPGDTIPVFCVYDNNGNRFCSENFMGKKSLLTFFNTGCNDCRRELTVIEDAYRKLNYDTTFCFIAIAREEAEENVLKYWNENNLTIPVYFDNDRKVYSLFANSMIPRIYAINPNGVVTYMGIETLNLTSEELCDIIIKQ